MPSARDTHPGDDQVDGRDETPDRARRPQLERGAAGAARHADRHADPHRASCSRSRSSRRSPISATASARFYLTLVVLSALSSIVALAPVALHRFLFQRRAKPMVVAYGHAALITALVTVSLLLVGVVAFVFDVVVGSTPPPGSRSSCSRS